MKQLMLMFLLIFVDEDFKVQPSIPLRVLMWSCKEDCSYGCIWETVNYFTSHGLNVPQFHGKVCYLFDTMYI